MKTNLLRLAVPLTLLGLALPACDGGDTSPFSTAPLAAADEKPDSPLASKKRPTKTAKDPLEVERAVALTTKKLADLGKSPANYKLVKAENLFAKAPSLWRVTFKPRRLIPADPSKEKIGAGGEIFINVDLKTGETEVRYGE